MKNKNKAIKTKKDKVTKSKMEFSKILCAFAIVVFTAVAIYIIIEYYMLLKLAIEIGSSVVPDASLPIAGITSIIAVILSYCLYQGALKNSLNKNKLTIDDNGLIKPILENLVKNNDDDVV